MNKKNDTAVRVITNELRGQSDQMADAALGIPQKAKSTLIKDRAAVETWSIPLAEIYKNVGVRLDASHYDRETSEALQQLAESGFELDPLSELADVRLPGQFVRIWASDKQYGRTYVNATDLMSLTGIGSLSGKPRYLSEITETDIDDLIIQEGWLLMTCSGTIGRIFHVPKRIDGWVATHDLIRIIPKKDVPVGFLHAYLSSPVAQKQIAGHTHGGQIDHVTNHQIDSVLVPRIPYEEKTRIHNLTMEALSLREKAILDLAHIAEDVQTSITRKP